MIRHCRARLRRYFVLTGLVILLFSPAKGQSDELLLRQKNPHTWDIVADGARGTLNFRRDTGLYRFQGHGLGKEIEYALVHCAGPIPSGYILARKKSDTLGRLQFSGSWQDWTGKFWLVLGADAVGEAGDSGIAGLDSLKSWHPGDYLFETRLL